MLPPYIDTGPDKDIARLSVIAEALLDLPRVRPVTLTGLRYWLSKELAKEFSSASGWIVKTPVVVIVLSAPPNA